MSVGADPRAGAAGGTFLAAGLAVALLVRVVAGGGHAASSFGGALAFGLVLMAVAVTGGWRPGGVRTADVAVGAVAGSVLVALPLLAGNHPRAGLPGPAAGLGVWIALVVLVAVSEEIVLRGLLFSALAARAGLVAATVVTATLFALVHVPLYGWRAAPLDLAVGMALGSLRALTGGVTAPATAHVVADLATLWL